MLPGGDTGRSVIGRTDIDGIGTAGLELQYDDLLAGTAGERVARGRARRSLDRRQRAGRRRRRSRATTSCSTLDRSVQYAAEQALLDTGRGELGAKRRPGRRDGHQDRRGPGDGLGAASTTSGVYEITSGNYSAVDAYEPGSVGKVITIAGALNEGTVTPGDVRSRCRGSKVYTKDR